MLNITSRLAVRIRHIPDWEFDWADTRPQMNRDLLTISDFLPSEADAAELKKRAVSYIMNFLVQEFPALIDLKKLLPRKPETVIAKSEVVPMQVLFKDEKYIAETIDILSQLADDAHLSGQTQVNTKLDGFSLTLRPSRSLSHKYIIMILNARTFTCHSTCISGCSRRSTDLQKYQGLQVVEAE